MDYVQLFLTSNCNKDCPFCFNRGVEERGDLSLKDFELLASILHDNNIKELDILGGEPLLHKDILGILKSASRYFHSIYISTNGSLIERLKKIKMLFGPIKTGISINTSITRELYTYIIINHALINR